MAYTAQSALLSDILSSILDQLVAVTDIDTNYVFLVANDNYDITCGEPKFIYVRYYGLDPKTDAGAGRRARPTSRRIRIYIYTRNNLDQYTKDDIALLGADNHEALELLTIDSLDEYYPKDDDDNLLTIEPLHPLDSNSGPPVRKAEDDIGLIHSHLDYEIVYLPRVNTPQP